MDALSDVLRVAHLTGGVFLHAEFFAPWCIAARLSPEHCAPLLGPASHLIIYHYVVEGDFSSGSRARTERPHPRGRRGRAAAAQRPASDGQRPEPAAGGGQRRHPAAQGRRVVLHPSRRRRQADAMICGFLGCASAEGNPVISTLPSRSSSTSRKRGRGMDPLDVPIRRRRGRRRPPGIGDRAGQAFGAAVCGSRAPLRRDAAGRPDRMARRLARPYVARALALLHRDSPGAGLLTTLAARSACRAPRWPTVSCA